METGRSARARADQAEGTRDRPDAFFRSASAHGALARGGSGRRGSGRVARWRTSARAIALAHLPVLVIRPVFFRRPGSRDRVRLARGRVRHRAARRVPSPTDANGRKKSFLPFPPTPHRAKAPPREGRGRSVASRACLRAMPSSRGRGRSPRTHAPARAVPSSGALAFRPRPQGLRARVVPLVFFSGAAHAGILSGYGHSDLPTISFAQTTDDWWGKI